MTTDTRRRVKLYALNADRQWDDRGTGHVSSTYVERLKGISLLVRAEADGSLLLESKIQPDTAYQKQQDTLIVWSEGDNFDLALSFQEKAGCDEIWEKICHVQGKDPSVDITQDIVEESEDERFDETSDSAPPIELPPCELARLEDISESIAGGLTTPLRKEKLAMALESDSYIKKLLVLFNMCEDLANADGLHHLYEIFKNIFLLNKNALFEIMFAEDTIFDVVGCLEYESGADPPRRHRQYLRQLAKFREAIPIRSADLLAKIHQTYRVQYIQDIILPTPSVFVEDNMLNTLSSFIFFNKVEIVTLIQEDEKFLVDMFALLTDPGTDEFKRRDIVLFLKEFCNFAQNLQAQGKDAFYKTLTMLGVLPALEITLVMADQRTKSASIDILTAIVEYSPCIIRNYTLQQVNKTDEEHMLMNIAIEQMLSDSEPELGGAVQIMGVVRILLDPENMITEKSDFLNFFYKHSIQTLIAPLLLNTLDDKPQNEDYQTVQLLGLVLELLSFCVEHHSYHMKNCILQKDLLKRILVLMKSTHTFLVLGALRLLRKIISLKDEFYNRHIVKGNLFAPVVDAFIRNNGRYNLLESAILELFEFIKVEDIKSLCTYVVENFTKIFDEIEYVQTFKHLKCRYDQHQEMLKERDKLLDSIPMIRNIRYKRDQRQLEEEEEIWFNEEEDFSDVPAAKPEIESYSMMKTDKLAADKINGPAKTVGTMTTTSAGSNSGSTDSSSSPPPVSLTHCSTNSSNSNTSSSSSPPPHQQQQQHLQHQQQQQQSSSVVASLAAAVVGLDATSAVDVLGAAAAAAAAVASAVCSSVGGVVVDSAPDVEPSTESTNGGSSCSSSSSSSSASSGADNSDDSSSSAFAVDIGTSPSSLASTPPQQNATSTAAADTDKSPASIVDATDSITTAAADVTAADSGASATALTADAIADDRPTVGADGADVDMDASAVVSEAAALAAVSELSASGGGAKETSAAGSLKKYLVDYGGDSDEDEEDDDDSTALDSPAPHKKARIL